MNITFLIGNGFDLNLGLKTSYKDFYKYYIKKEPKDFIAKSISSDYKLWADLELGLGYFLKKCTKKDIETFLSSKLLLEDHLTEYLKNENSRIVYLNEEKIGKELAEFLKSINKNFNENDDAHYKAIINNSSFICYKFITFNYTDVLDRIVSFAKSYLKPFVVLYRDKKRTEFSNHSKTLSSAQKNIILNRIIIVKNSDIFSFKNITRNKSKNETYKNDILNCIKTHAIASINDIKTNTPFSLSTIRKYLKELEEEGAITFEIAKHNKKMYKLI